MEDKVKNIICYLQDDEDKWKGNIILDKENSFKGIAHNRINNSYIIGSIVDDSICFSVANKSFNPENYSLNKTGSFNGVEYYDGTYIDYNGLNHKCYLTVENSNEDIKVLKKDINNILNNINKKD